jgi:hypothetical protein
MTKAAGLATAQPNTRLWLLGSPPDQFHGLGLHGTRPKKFIIDYFLLTIFNLVVSLNG